MKNRKKPLIIALICVGVLAAAAAGVWFFWLRDYLAASNASPVYVNSISSIIGLDTGANPRYSGVIEPQETYKINKDETKTVAEILVEEGDEVHIGDVLFRYDTEDLQLSLRQAQIDLEGIANQISSLKAQITELNSEKKKASKDEQYSYTVRIQGIQLQVEQLEYQSSVKNSEIEKLEADLNNTDVASQVEGVVKEVNSTPSTDPSGQPAAFISILSSGEYRVKGTVSELNMGSLSEGQAVVVHSRIDAEATWRGTVETIDREPASDQNTNMAFYYGMDTGEKSSKYNFYVILEDLEGLILGQHVYIEPDLGEAAKKEGLWLPAVYVAHDESGSFVWAKNEKDKLEKRIVILGEYDSENDLYQIKSGVTKADSIAYPREDLMPGMPTTTDASAQELQTDDSNQGSPAYDPGFENGVPPVADDGGTLNGVVPEEEGGGSAESGMEEDFPVDGGYDDGANGDADGGAYGEGLDDGQPNTGDLGQTDENTGTENMDDYYYDEVNNTFVHFGNDSPDGEGVE